MTDVGRSAGAAASREGDLVRRHRLSTRIWHWVNVVAFVVMLMSGLMIFNAHPRLYWGQYGANADPAWLEIGEDGGRGYLRVGERRGRHDRGARRSTAGGSATRAFPAGRRSRRATASRCAALAPGLRLGARRRARRPTCVLSLANGHLWRDLLRGARAAAGAPLARHQASRPAAVPEGRGGAALQHAAEARLCRGALRAAPADGADRPDHVAGDGRGLAVAGRPVRRAAVGALDPLPRRLAARCCSSSSISSWWCSPARSTRCAR